MHPYLFSGGIYMNEQAQIIYEKVMEQEKQLVFQAFSPEDAFALAMIMKEKAQAYPDPLSIEIIINGLTVFRYFPSGTTSDNANWLRRKHNVVDRFHISSLGFMKKLEAKGETLRSALLDEADYAFCGGAFPIRLKGTGVIGSIGVSGYPHENDHQIIVDSIAAFLGVTL